MREGEGEDERECVRGVRGGRQGVSDGDGEDEHWGGGKEESDGHTSTQQQHTTRTHTQTSLPPHTQQKTTTGKGAPESPRHTYHKLCLGRAPAPGAGADPNVADASLFRTLDKAAEEAGHGGRRIDVMKVRGSPVCCVL